MTNFFKIPTSLKLIVSFSNTRSYTHKVSPIELPKHEPNKDDTNGHAKLDRKDP